MSEKRIALFLCILIALLTFAFPVLAYDGAGTAEAPYLVGNYEDFVSAVGKGGFIRLTENIPLTSRFNFPAVSLTIDGQGQYGFVAAASTWPTGSSTKHLVSINTGDASVTFKDLVFDCAGIAQGINVYQAKDVTLDNVTIANCSTKALAVLTVNASNVKVENGLDIPDKLTIAIDVGKGKGLADPSFTLKGDCTINGMVWSTLTNADISLYAGTYNKKPDAKYIAEGYYARDNENGTWTIVPETYSVIFLTNGGTEVKEVSFAYGEKPVLPEAPVKEGFVFAGWYTDPEFTSLYDENTVPAEGFTLYAAWTEAPEEPQEPAGPEAPEEPQEPAGPETPDEPEEPAAPEKAPVTGDTAAPLLWAGMMLVAALAACMLAKRHKTV